MGMGGITTEVAAEVQAGLRRNLTMLLDHVEQRDSGLLITIDEVHAQAAELRQISALTQHLIREGRQFALVLAGLPSAVSSLLSDRVLTFLRRADKHVLGDVRVEEVYDALVATFGEHGRDLAPAAARAAAEATFGYPFLVQLVGYHVWRAAANGTVTEEDVQRGVAAARRRLGSLVHETALNDLSELDRTFLVAMAADDGPSQMGDIRRRMGGVSPQHGNTYRNRLLVAGVIQQIRRGQVDFALPYLREFLRDHGASSGLVPDPRG